MKIPYTQDEINEACIASAEAQGIKDGYIRPVVFRGSEMMAVSAQNTKIHVAIACWPWPSYFSPAEKLKGIRLDISRWRRPSPDISQTKYMTMPARQPIPISRFMASGSRSIAEAAAG